jgi:uncharacterized protein with HEPN domain
MKRLPATFLWDIEQTCTALMDFLHETNLTRYERDLMLRSAVERQLQNIGEALSQLSRLVQALAVRVPQYRKLIGFRNVLVHGYAGLNNAEVWRVLHENLPELHTAAASLLEELDPPTTG